MSKYIDADELKNAFTNWREIVNNPYDLFPSVEECKAVIDAQPTADVVEVRHGRWELYDICSVCGAQAEQQTNYCPNCGSRMDGDAE